MNTPKTGGRYKRLANGTVVPADQVPVPIPAPAHVSTTTADPVPSTAADTDNPKEGD